jgi:hypothetical protein
MRNSVLCAAAVVALGSHPVQAQRLTELASGTHVRVERCDHDRFSGPLMNADADTVRITAGRNQPPVALASPRICGYAIGAGSDRARGAWGGLAIGGGVGLVLWALVKATSPVSYNDAPRHARNLGIVTTILGVAVGAVVAPERWVPPRQ